MEAGTRHSDHGVHSCASVRLPQPLGPSHSAPYEKGWNSFLRLPGTDPLPLVSVEIDKAQWVEAAQAGVDAASATAGLFAILHEVETNRVWHSIYELTLCWD